MNEFDVINSLPVMDCELPDTSEDSIEHFGIPRQKWGERRFQNEDGSLTPAGRERYGVGEPREKTAKVSTATQLTSGSSTNSGAKVGFFERKKQEKAAEQKKAQQQASLQKARQTKAANEAKKQAAEAEERQRKADLDSGDYAKISKWVSKSTADELNAALNKADIAAKINQKAGPEIEEAEKRAAQAAMKSGDLSQVKKYATNVNVSDQDLRNAVNKINVMKDLRDVQPKKTAADHIDNACKQLNRAMGWYDTGTALWNRIAAANNAFNREGNDLPLIGQNNSGLMTAAQKAMRKQEEQRAMTVNKAIRSGKADKIEKAMPLMTSNELQAAYNYLNNKEALKQTINSQKNSATEKAARDSIDRILRSGNADEILKNQASFSTNDLNAARDRTNSINTLQKNAMAQRARSLQASGKTYDEIADALNIPKGSVGNLLFGGKG